MTRVPRSTGYFADAYAAVVSRDGALDPALLDRIEATGHLYFHRWKDYAPRLSKFVTPSGRAALFVWSVGDRHVQRAEPIVRHGPLAGVLDGYLAIDNGNLGDVLREIDARRMDAHVARLGGTFTIGAIDERDDTFTAWNCFLATQPLIHAQGRRQSVASSSIVLAHAIAQDFGPFDYNISGLGDHIQNEQFYPFETAFKNTHVLPPNSTIRLDRSGISVREIDEAFARVGAGSGEASSAYLDDCAQDLVSALQSFRGGGQYSIGLTAGRDSRTLLSALRAAGVNVFSFTGGPEEWADVKVARRIADKLGVPWVYNKPIRQGGAGRVTPYNYVAGYVRRSEAMGAYRPSLPDQIERIGPNLPEPERSFDGLAGEMLRGGSFLIPAGYYMNNRVILSPEEVRGMIDEIGRFPCDDLLAPGVASSYRDRLTAWTDKHWNPEEPMAVVERFAMEHYYAMNHNFLGGIMPLADNRLLRRAQQIGLRERQKEVVPYSIVQRLAPELLNIPLDNSRWQVERDGPLDGDQAAWEARAPIVNEGISSSNYVYLMAGFEPREELADVILNSKGSAALGQIVDMDRVRRFFHSRDIYHVKKAWGIWNLYQAAIVLSGVLDPKMELPAPKPIEVTIDAQWYWVATELLDVLKGVDAQVEDLEKAAALTATTAATKAPPLRNSFNALHEARLAVLPRIAHIPSRPARWVAGGALVAARMGRDAVRNLTMATRTPPAAQAELAVASKRKNAAARDAGVVLRHFRKGLIWLRDRYSLTDERWGRFLDTLPLANALIVQDQPCRTAGELYRALLPVENPGLPAVNAPEQFDAKRLVREIRLALKVTTGEDEA